MLDSWHLPRMSQLEINSPEETEGTPGIVLPQCTWETERPGPGKWIRCMAHLGQCTQQAPGCLSCLDLGRAQNARPPWVCAPAENLRTWAAQTWEVHERHSPLRRVPLKSTLEPEKCKLRKYTLPWAVANSLQSIHCKHSPHMPVVFVCSVPTSPTTQLDEWA